MKLIFLALLILGSNNLFASENESKIKSCLAALYSFQKNHQKEFGKYSETMSDFKSEKYPDCQNFKIESVKVSNKTFEIILKIADQAWSVDSKKMIKKLQMD